MAKAVSKQLNIQSIPYTSVSTFLGLESQGNNAETWKVTLRSSPTSVTAYLKLCRDHKQIVAEIVSAKVGRALNLRVPNFYLVFVDTSEIPSITHKPSLFSNSGITLAFASESPNSRTMSFERLLRIENATANTAFDEWKDYNLVVAFDEWIANPDRNWGNFLFTPGDSNFWLIDHGAALTGDKYPQWSLNQPSISTHNALLEMKLHSLSTTEKEDIQSAAFKLMDKARTIEINSINTDNFVNKISPNTEVEKIIKFLALRIDQTAKELCKKIGLPQLDI